MTFLRSLLSSDENSVDSIVLGGLAALMVLFGVTIYVAAADHTSWNPISFGGSAATIIGAAAGGKTARDRLSQPDGEQPK